MRHPAIRRRASLLARFPWRNKIEYAGLAQSFPCTGEKSFPHAATSWAASPFPWGGLPKPLATRAPQIHVCDVLPWVGRPPAMDLLRLPPGKCRSERDRFCGASRPLIRRAVAGSLPTTNWSGKGRRPSHCQGFPRFSLRCKPGDPPPTPAYLRPLETVSRSAC